MSRLARHAGFTLIEIMIALAILAIAMTVMVETQGGAVQATLESERYLIATQLAQEKMSEIQFRLEKEGFSQSDMNEEGDFVDYGATFGDVEMDLEEYKWAYTVRSVDFALGDVTSAMGELQSAGAMPSSDASSSSGSGSSFGGDASASSNPMDMASMLPTDQLSDMLSPYLREVRIVVWWGTDDDFSQEGGCTSCVELVTHVVNPSGQLNIPQDGSSQ